MEKGQMKIIEALEYAIQMELDGKKFYGDCAGRSGNRTGKEIFTWLAKQEDTHRERFSDICASLTAKKGWSKLDVTPVNNIKLHTMFYDALKETGTSVKSNKDEVKSISRALDLEIKSRDFYKTRASLAESDIEKSFFNLIANEEQGHYMALVDYKEYLEDPIDWFTRTEHHSMDGA